MVKRSIFVVLALLFVSLVIWVIWSIAYVIRRGDPIGDQYVSINYVTDATIKYIQTNHDWPRSWEDLARTTPKVSRVEMPRDRQMVEKYVFMDFNADLRQIASEEPAKFTGFGPKDVPYYHYESCFEDIIAAAKQPQLTTLPN